MPLGCPPSPPRRPRGTTDITDLDGGTVAQVEFPNPNDLTNFTVIVSPDSGCWAGVKVRRRQQMTLWTHSHAGPFALLTILSLSAVLDHLGGCAVQLHLRHPRIVPARAPESHVQHQDIPPEHQPRGRGVPRHIARGLEAGNLNALPPPTRCTPQHLVRPAPPCHA